MTVTRSMTRNIGTAVATKNLQHQDVMIVKRNQKERKGGVQPRGLAGPVSPSHSLVKTPLESGSTAIGNSTECGVRTGVEVGTGPGTDTDTDGTRRVTGIISGAKTSQFLEIDRPEEPKGEEGESFLHDSEPDSMLKRPSSPLPLRFPSPAPLRLSRAANLPPTPPATPSKRRKLNEAIATDIHDASDANCNDSGNATASATFPPLHSSIPLPFFTTLHPALQHLLRVNHNLLPLIQSAPECPIIATSAAIDAFRLTLRERRRADPSCAPTPSHKLTIAPGVDFNPFRSLVTAIIGQQISGKAATAVNKRFVELFYPPPSSSSSSSPYPSPTSPSKQPPTPSRVDDVNDDYAGSNPTPFPSPSTVLTTPLETLRSAGLSARKAEYIHNVARAFQDGTLSAEGLIEGYGKTRPDGVPADADADAELVARITAIKGLGKWTAEMFATFALGRCDVFSTGDVGVEKAMATMEGWRRGDKPLQWPLVTDVRQSTTTMTTMTGDSGVKKVKAKTSVKAKWRYMSPQQMLHIAEQYRPWRAVFMWYMWKVTDTEVAFMMDGKGGGGEAQGNKGKASPKKGKGSSSITAN